MLRVYCATISIGVNMRIVCLTTFLDGRDRYEEGDVRTVSDVDGQRFVDQGWASADGVTATPVGAPSTDLDVQNAKLGVADSKGA